MAERIYCADSTALIWLQRNIDKYALGDIWDAVAELIEQGRMFAPIQVRDEVDRGWDELGAWCRQFAGFLRDVTEEVANIVGDLGTSYPGSSIHSRNGRRLIRGSLHGPDLKTIGWLPSCLEASVS